MEVHDLLFDLSGLKAPVGDVADRIRNFLQTDLRVHGRNSITDGTPLLDGLVDSLQVMRVIAFVEDEFRVTIDIALVTEENFRTIADIERLVAGLKEIEP